MPENIVPFADLRRQHLDLQDEINSVIADVIDQSAFVRGPYVENFERKFALSMEAPHCISCGNGTDALFVALKCLNVKAGDEVIVPAMSWISTSETVTQAGGRVVFCDIDPVTFCIDSSKVENRITRRTVGIIPVHLYGHAANMQALKRIADQHELWILEDCAQAHLARFRGVSVGSFGAAGAFSFYPGKNLGALGDAGALVTHDKSLAVKMAQYARHGGLIKGEHLVEGINSRLDGLQAAILSIKLQHLFQWTNRRRLIAEMYLNSLENLGNILLPVESSDVHHVWHLFVLQSPNRDEFREFLYLKGVSTSVNYPIPLPLLPCYSHLGHQLGDFPVAEKLARDGLSIPLYPELSDDQVNYVVDCIREWGQASA